MTARWKPYSTTAEDPPAEVVFSSPFRRIEVELNAILLSLMRQQKIDEATYHKLHSVDGTPPAIRGSSHLYWLSTLQYIQISNGYLFSSSKS